MTANTIILNSADDITVELKEKIAENKIEELFLNFSLSYNGEVIDSPFAYLKSLEEIKFKLTIGENCLSLEKLFYGCESLKKAPILKTDHIKNFSYMFENCYSLENVPEYAMNCAEKLIGMFKNCKNLSFLPEFKVPSDVDMFRITQGCKNIIYIPKLKSPKIILDTPDDVTDLIRLRVANLDLEEIIINCDIYRKMLFGQFTENNSPFSGIPTLDKIPFKITIGPNCHSLEGLFYGCSNLCEIPEMNTSEIHNMSSMFYECSSLIKLPMLDTHNVTNFQNTFHGCKKLSEFPKWNTSSAQNMFGMFEGCASLTTLPLIDTSSVIKLSWFVSGCENLIEFPKINTAKAEEMSFIFNKCYSLKSIPKLDISQIKDPDKIFNGYNNKKAIKSFFGTLNLRSIINFLKKLFKLKLR